MMENQTAIKWLEDGFDQTVEKTKEEADDYGGPLIPGPFVTDYVQWFKPVGFTYGKSAFASLKDG